MQLNSQLVQVRKESTAAQESLASLPDQSEIETLQERVSQLSERNQDLTDELSVFKAKELALRSSARVEDAAERAT